MPGHSPKAGAQSTTELTSFGPLFSEITVLRCLMFSVSKTYSMYFVYISDISGVWFCWKLGFEHLMGFVSAAHFRDPQGIPELDPTL